MDAYLFGIAVVASTIIIGLWRRAVEASIWLAVAIVGQAAALQIVDAGPRVHYQHFRALTDLLGQFNLALMIVVAQAVAVGLRLLKLRADRTSDLSVRRLLQPGQWIALGIALFAMSATISRDPRFYAQELVMAATVQLVNLATVVLFAMTVPKKVVESVRAWLRRVFGDEGDRPTWGARRIDPVAAGGAVWLVGISMILAFFAYEHHPHMADEVGYLYHARYFAQGMIAMPAPPVPGAFDLDLFTYEPNRWYSPVSPGWPAMLAIGARFGAEWLVNPLLSGINVFLAWLLVKRLYDVHTARIASLLLCVSPWHVFMAMNFMTHTFSFTCLLVAALCVERMRSTGNAWLGLAGGSALALISLIRPLEGAIVALAMGLWSLGAHGRSFRFAPTVVLTLVTMVVGSVQLAYNASLTGSAGTFPLMKYFDVTYYSGSNDLGFGPNLGNLGWPLDPFPGHGLRDVLVNANLNLTSVNIELFGWATGSLILVALLVVSGGMTRKDYYLAVLSVLTAAVYSLYWFGGGPDFGARYWYPILLPCIILSTRGLDWLVKRVDIIASGGSGGTRVILGVGAMVLAAVVTFFPWRAVDKYHHYRGMRPDVRTLSTETPFGRSVVFVRGNRAPDYASAAIYNPVDLNKDAPIFAWDRDLTVRQQVLMAYPDRRVWFLNGPTVTGKGFEIAGGPLTTAEAARFPLSGFQHP